MARNVTITVKAPIGAQPTDIAGLEAAGAAWYPLQMARELDDAILCLSTSDLDMGTWLLKTGRDAAAVLANDALTLAHQDHRLVNETIRLMRLTFARRRPVGDTNGVNHPGPCSAPAKSVQAPQ